MNARVRDNGPALHVYLRRSKAEQGHQQFSLDVQREGSRHFVTDDLPALGIDVRWGDRFEYVDDDRAGDDFIGRTELKKMRDSIQPGDIVLCRDQSRLGRDALEVTLAIRDIVRDRGGRLFFYTTKQETQFKNAIDAATTFIVGTGHQIELEAIRSRTKEALRSRVRAGRIAGGRCYGYTLVRQTDASGRQFTTAKVNPEQAKIVVRIFERFVASDGLKRIAIDLNAEHIPSPSAGRRGTGSWSPSCIREMLRNDRYRGVYIHGRYQRIRRGGKRLHIKAPANEVITVDLLEWRIVDDALWFAAQERFAKQADRYNRGGGRRQGPATRYPLSGLAHCTCKGSVGVVNTKLGMRIVRAYGCTWHHVRGKDVCDVAVRQPIEEVQAALINYLDDQLTPELKQRIVADTCAVLEAQLSASGRDTAEIEQELAELRREQKNLARAVAAGGDAIPELVGELRARSERIRLRETDLAAAKRTPTAVRQMMARAEREATHLLAEIRAQLQSASADELRDTFVAMFEDDPLTFEEVKRGHRRVWRIRGTARLSSLKLRSDPDGI